MIPPRVHCAARRRCGNVADCDAGAAAGDAVIGYLGASLLEAFASRLQAFRQGLAETGYQEGRNVRVGCRWAESRFDLLPVLASGLVDQRPSVIVAAGTRPRRWLSKRQPRRSRSSLKSEVTHLRLRSSPA